MFANMPEHMMIIQGCCRIKHCNIKVHGLQMFEDGAAYKKSCAVASQICSHKFKGILATYLVTKQEQIRSKSGADVSQNQEQI